jgi:hypothetical protein
MAFFCTAVGLNSAVVLYRPFPKSPRGLLKSPVKAGRRKRGLFRFSLRRAANTPENRVESLLHIFLKRDTLYSYEKTVNDGQQKTGLAKRPAQGGAQAFQLAPPPPRCPI